MSYSDRELERLCEALAAGARDAEVLHSHVVGEHPAAEAEQAWEEVSG